MIIVEYVTIRANALTRTVHAINDAAKSAALTFIEILPRVF